MTSREFEDRLSERLRSANATLAPGVVEQLEAYYRLLERWNARINFTSLPLQSPTGETFDRLLVEPIVASSLVADSAQVWFDLGSGGGSPALPLKILRPRTRLVMVESKARKAAFLREATRALSLTDVHVENARFEDVAAEAPLKAQLVTARAVKADKALFDSARALLGENGRLFWFRSKQPASVQVGFRLLRTVPLTASLAELDVLEPMFHVEHGASGTK